MAINHRDILGPAFDNGLAGVNQTDGSDPTGQPLGVSDQTSAEFAPRASHNAADFQRAKAAAQGVADAGATGARVAAAGQLVTQGSAPANTFGPADVVAAEGNNLARRSDGGDSGTDGTGKTVG